jgi:RHH-type transcriptional regulator, proline utilization regulon repressor / proline dehydrogenase / delta 1-pyrroline-5-carboxylate dehydrogenase
MDAASASPFRLDRLPPPVRDEADLIAALAAGLHDTLDWNRVVKRATPWVDAARAHPAPFWALESLLLEFPLSSAEGLALMRLAEALLRVPDLDTAAEFAADQLEQGHFARHVSPRTEGGKVGWLSSRAVDLVRRLLPDEPSADTAERLMHRLGVRLGARSVIAATRRAIALLGQQFVLGQDLAEALGRRERHERVRYSFDMLGEGARSDADAQRYARAYRQAIRTLAAAHRPATPEDGDGLSVKLSALDPRFEPGQRMRVMHRLLPRLMSLVDEAASAGLALTIDAEESERLELTLDLLDAASRHAARHFPGWHGLGLAVQAYQQRATSAIAEIGAIAARHQRRLMVRLVKGAYWDAEIKRAQELGLAGYPVWTHKEHTDLAYLACARLLLERPGEFLPMFASHNAATVAAVLELAGNTPVELQRLHGMGLVLSRELLRDPQVARVRVYAPVGRHRDLLSYLVRRLLENGANSSFVHRLTDEGVSTGALLASPLKPVSPPPPGSGLASPRQLHGVVRLNAFGLDLGCAREHRRIRKAIESLHSHPSPPPPSVSVAMARQAMDDLHAAQPSWAATPLPQRCAVLHRAAALLEEHLPEYCAQLALEGRKTLPDALAEVRETIDYCRYYATQASSTLEPQRLGGPTGERNELHWVPRGVFVAISPWNFPLAIMAGQMLAALVCGNTVAAKPAEQTPQIALAWVDLLHQAGLPQGVLRVLPGPGETVGAALVAHPRCAGVVFTGSTQVARQIWRCLASGDGPIVPLIAETGGLNAMVVDSSALPEQVVDAVVQSAFRSAGQRCSALRLLCLHEEVAEAVLTLLDGAMQTLVLGDPAELSTDVGPVIDARAHQQLNAHLQRLDREAHCLARTPLPSGLATTHVAPVVYELAQIGQLREEVFGPVLHVVRWTGAVEPLIEAINALGYGLTLGVQTRIDRRAERIAALARVGNVYINRNMIGAVVGVQPFGGMGLSGTGPKAGGPHYLPRFCAEQTRTVNTAAAGGNATLLASDRL